MSGDQLPFSRPEIEIVSTEVELSESEQLTANEEYDAYTDKGLSMYDKALCVLAAASDRINTAQETEEAHMTNAQHALLYELTAAIATLNDKIESDGPLQQSIFETEGTIDLAHEAPMSIGFIDDFTVHSFAEAIVGAVDEKLAQDIEATGSVDRLSDYVHKPVLDALSAINEHVFVEETAQ